MRPDLDIRPLLNDAAVADDGVVVDLMRVGSGVRVRVRVGLGLGLWFRVKG